MRAVLDDAERVRGSRLWMDVVYDRGLRIAYLRALFIPEEPPQGLDAVVPAEALVEVADAVFELLADEDWQTPFVCLEHGFGPFPLGGVQVGENPERLFPVESPGAGGEHGDRAT